MALATEPQATSRGNPVALVVAKDAMTTPHAVCWTHFPLTDRQWRRFREVAWENGAGYVCAFELDRVSFTNREETPADKVRNFGMTPDSDEDFEAFLREIGSDIRRAMEGEKE